MMLYLLLFVFFIGFLHTHQGMTRNIIAKEIEILSKLIPLKNESYVMFWRPQKVGSSTILSFLISYAYRYNLSPKRRGLANGFCMKMIVCLSYSNYSNDPALMMSPQQIHSTQTKLQHVFVETESEKLLYTMSWSHQLCNLPSYLITASLPCAFTKDYHYLQHQLQQQQQRNNNNNKNNYSKLQSIHPSPSSPPPFLLPPPMTNNMKELFTLRDPLSRMISIYYFWGELFRLKLSTTGNILPQMAASLGKQLEHRFNLQNSVNMDIFDKGGKKKGYTSKSSSKNNLIPMDQNDGDSSIVRIGNKIDKVKVIKGSFDYHGNESSPPDEAIAMKFATNLPLKPGMPGPSYSWSAISNTYEDAVNELKTDRIMTIVMERLDESLVVASHYLNWSLADIVVVKNRKALSTHPKHTEWPQAAIEVMKKSLMKGGEYAVYETARIKLNERIDKLKSSGVAIENQIQLLIYMRRKVSEICLSDSVMIIYRDFIASQGYEQHFSNNKLRDTEDSYVVGGHSFSYNGDLIHSFDVCGNCEAHALLFHIQLDLHSTSRSGGSVTSITTLTAEDIQRVQSREYPSLFNMAPKHRLNNINFQNCPSHIL